MFIEEVKASIIRNSRKEKTIQIQLKTPRGLFVASAPSGKSTGKHETPAYNYRGIEHSLIYLKEFCRNIEGKNFVMLHFEELQEFEDLIIKFEKENEKLGANCTYALETAFLKAAAKENGKELWEFISGGEFFMPMPVGNCIGGGLHSKKTKKSSEKVPDFQEFLLIPEEKRFSTAVTKNIHAYFKAKTLLRKAERKLLMKKNDENAWKTTLTNEETLEILKKVADEFKLRIGLDVASSSFYDGKKQEYVYKNKAAEKDREEQISYMQALIDRYNIFYVEDSLNEEDFVGFSRLRSNGLIVGDDLTVTNLDRLKKAVGIKAINAMIVKPNQNGYIMKVTSVVEFCKKNKIKMIFSHRSGETMDDALADYAVGFGADFIKTGIYGKERLIKLRKIMHIEKKFHTQN